MNPESDRRVFVRSMLVGIPALAGAPVLSSTVHGSAGGDAYRRIVEAPTPGIDQALRELSALHNQMVQRGPARSDARLIAPPLRSLMTYHQQSNRDIELSAALRDLVAREGRERLSRLDPDPALLNRGLQHYGLRAPVIVLGADSRRRADALDVLVREGPGAFYEDVFGIVSMFGYAIEAPGWPHVLRLRGRGDARPRGHGRRHVRGGTPHSDLRTGVLRVLGGAGHLQGAGLRGLVLIRAD